MIRSTVLSGAAALLLACAAELQAQAYLVKDTKPGSGDGVDFFGATSAGCCTAEEVAAIGDTLYFAANDGPHGLELWRTDGTEVGTVLVKDINPGSNSSGPDDFTRVGSVIFFRADDGVHGYELWKTDGTAAGTVLVKDVNPGPAPGLDLPSGDFKRQSAAAVSNLLFFIGTDGIHGYELWKSDGTDGGTVLVKDIVAGIGNPNLKFLRPFAGALYFSAYSGPGGGGLWKSDGTEIGTTQVRAFASDQPFYFTQLNGVLYFAADDSGDPSGLHSGLWKSDGTTAGTVQVTGDLPMSDQGSTALQTVNGQIFFSVGGQAGPWVSDGTEAGTRLIKSINPGLGSVNKFVAIGGLIFFAAYDPAHGSELWRTDGTDAGTVLVKDINPGSSDGMDGMSSKALTSMSGALYFRALDIPTGPNLWTSDGTTAGTGIFQSLDAYPVVRVGDVLYLNAKDPFTGRELWALKVYALTVNDVAVREGDSGTVDAIVTVTLSAPAPTTVTVSYATADGTATAGSDYVATSAILTFAPGQVTQTFSVTVMGDTIPESNETFLVNLTSPTGATIADRQAVGLILDDEPGQFYALAPCRVADTRNAPGPSGEPSLGANTTRTFPVTGLCGLPPTAKAVAINVVVVNETDFGDLRLYPAGSPVPGSSTVNFSVQKVRSNNAVIPVGLDGEISVRCDMPSASTGLTHFLFDVYGYFQ
jgi:ELWxxDGT repeat protein